MGEYIIYDIKCTIFAILCIVLYIIFDKKTKKIQIIDIVMIVLLIVISGIRCNFGSDTYNYYRQYVTIDIFYEGFWEAFNSSYQSGFISLCYIIYQITHFDFAIFWVVAIIIYPTVIIYIRKKAQKPSLAFAMYMLMGFFVISNNILKQNIAMIILMIAYFSFLKKKKYMRYALLVFIASKFHATAIIGGILLIIGTRINPTYKNLKIFIILGVIGALLYNVVVPIAIQNISILSRYESYIDMDRSITTIIRGTLNTVSYVIMYTILAVTLIKNKDRIKEVEGQNSLIDEQISFLFIAIMFSIISISNQTINRIGLYFYQFIIFMLPSLFYIKYDSEKKKKYMTLLIILILGWFLFNNIIGAENRYYDYSTYFTDVPKRYY